MFLEDPLPERSLDFSFTACPVSIVVTVMINVGHAIPLSTLFGF
jgi:hypothetical protein